ncbi:MAG: SDR family oxidoreductase [Leucobacter sp.]|nr:SDR family oxidoreductase [Leucobacter sp.]
MTTTAVITGGARGIGRAIAERLRAAGHELAIVDLSPDLEEVAAELGALAIRADVSSEAGVATVREALERSGRPVGVLVNNAGITRDAIVHKMTEEEFAAVIRVNLGSTYRMTEGLADLLVDGGTIVNLSSRAQLGNVGQFNYAMSKTGIIGLTRAHALALAPRLRVNAVAPGFIASAMTDKMPAEIRERVIASVPLARPGQPEDIANTVAWLASDESGYVTGQVLYVCGGRSFS